MSLKFEKSNLIHIKTKDNLVILTHKTDTLITLTTFLKKCEKSKGGFTYRAGGSLKGINCVGGYDHKKRSHEHLTRY